MNRAALRGLAALAALGVLFPPQTAPAEDRLYRPMAVAATQPFPQINAPEDEATLLLAWAPRFEVAEGERSFNRIGAPRLRARNGHLKADVDPEIPTLYAELRHDEIAGRSVLQLVYRVHFTRLPLTPAVFFERHRNVGLLVLVTLDAESRAPLLLTTVYTCGCYRALLPTSLFPKEQLPRSWPVIVKKIFGIRLPSIVSVVEPERTSWVIHLASRTHRVDGIRLVEKTAVDAEGVPMPILPMSTLRNLPVEGSAGRVASFFYTSGLRKGHVRGAFSPIEGLTAGLLLLDPMLGMDKDFGDPETTGTRFYTGLLPWQRNASRLDRFDPLIRSLGFRLPALPRRRLSCRPDDDETE